MKNNLPDQNAINLSAMSLKTPQKLLFKKGPPFVPTPSDVKWLTLRKDFDKFVNQLRYQLKHTNQQSSTFPAGNCMFKVNNRNTRTRCEICSKLTIKTPERR